MAAPTGPPRALTATLALTAAGLCASPSASGQSPSPAPNVRAAKLFQTDRPLTLTIEVPLRDVFKERSQNSHYHAGQLRLADDPDRVLPIQLKTRGKFRLRRSTCNFPPLRIQFDSGSAVRTPFEGQRALKLVTHCRTGKPTYQEYVLKEYLLYQTYRLLTDLSFGVRLARITYIDPERTDDAVISWGFFIEDEEAMAARSGWSVVHVPVVPPDVQDREQIALVDLFQYMIGNTDWNYFIAAHGEAECCHNARIVGNPQGPVFPVPYDFDFSGVVNARYAKPDERLGIRNVRQRYYLGVCRPAAELRGPAQRFRDRREEIYALWRGQEDLSEDAVAKTLDYFDEFFERTADAARAERRFRQTCRRLSSR